MWHDEDYSSDQENSFSVTEPGLNGVVVYLYRDADGDGAFEPGTEPNRDGDPVYVTTTISGTSHVPPDLSPGYPDGIYGFDMSGLDAYEYYWVWVDESTLQPAGTWILTTGSNPQLVYYQGGDDFTIDFGYVYAGPPQSLGSIGDYVWEEGGYPLNNWQGDLGDWGINDVVVELWKGGVLQDTFTTITDTVTGDLGYYLFEGLAAGDYVVKLADSNFEQGGRLYDFSFVTRYGDDGNPNPDERDSDFDPASRSALVTLLVGEQNLTIDAGLNAPAAPTAVTLSSFAARSSAGGSASPVWPGLAGVTILAAGSLFWKKRRTS